MLLYYVLLSYWLLTIAAAVVTYFVPLLSATSAYGKLSVQRSKAHLSTATSRSSSSPSPTSHSPSRSSASSTVLSLYQARFNLLLSRCLYLSNGRCFTFYYVLASLLNGVLLRSVYAWYSSGVLDGVLLGVAGVNRWLVWRVVPSLAFSSLDRHWPPQHSAAPVSLLVLYVAYQLHFARRLWECCCVHRFSETSQQHVLVLLFGALFYVALILSPVCDELHRTTTSRASQPSELRAISSVIATILFVAASVWQHSCHRTLAELRSSSTSSSAAATYSIPRGSGFSYLLCPHYTAELLIYLSMALMRSCLLQWLALLWTAVNLTITATKTRHWYASKWPQGEWKSRWTILPFVM